MSLLTDLFCFKVNHNLHILCGVLNDRQKKYSKYVEQFQRVTEMMNTLGKVKVIIDDIVPCMDRLNQILPSSEQLEPFTFRPVSVLGKN